MRNQIFIAIISLFTILSSCNKKEESTTNLPKPSSLNYNYYQDQVLLSQAWLSGEPITRNSESGMFKIDSIFFVSSVEGVEVDTDTLEISINNIGVVSVVEENNLPLGAYQLGISVENDLGRFYNNEALIFDVVDLESPEIILENTPANNHYMIELNGDGTIKDDLTEIPDLKVFVERADLYGIDMTRPGDRYYYSIVEEEGGAHGVVNFVQPLVLEEKDTIRFNALNVAGVAEEKFVVVEAFVPMPTIIVELEGVTEPVPSLIDENGKTIYSTVQGVVVKWENMAFEDLIIAPSDKFSLIKIIDETTGEEYAYVETPGTYNQETITATINGETLAGPAVEQTIAVQFMLDTTPVESRDVYSLDTPSLTLGKLNGVLEADFNGMYSYYIKGLLEGTDIGTDVWIMEVANDAKSANPNPLPILRYYAEKLNRAKGNQSEYVLISPEVSIVDAREISINAGTYYDEFSTINVDDAQKVEYKIVTEDQYNAFIAIPIEDEAERQAAAATWSILKSINGSDTADYTKDLNGKTSKYWDSTMQLKINDIEELPGDNIRIAVHIINSRETVSNRGKTGLDKFVVTGKYKI